MGGFVHLHLHSVYSLLDGACHIDRVISKAKEMGQTALAVTDHGVMYGAIEFYKEAKKQGIKPIIGCEVYIAARSRFDNTHGLDSEIYHLVLLCKNNTGYLNLIKLVSSAWTEGFYKKPRIDRELLEQHHEGLIALSACLAGEIPRALASLDYQKALDTANYYKNLFGEDFYIELQDHNLPEQQEIAPKLIKLANELDIQLVLTNDVHYVNKEDSKAQQVLICIQTGKTVSDDERLEFGSDEFYLKSEGEMRELFRNHPEAADNTVKIAEKCNVEFEFGKTKLPHFEVPGEISHYDYFKKLCSDGLKRRYGENPSTVAVDRLNYELSVIETMGYVDYYLIVNDFISYAKSQNIPVGPGRGSGAGSIAAYCIGITDIDPLKYNLLFERFLNPERVSMPDFDVDFCYERRPEVIEYVIRKYGADHVAQIATFGTMAAKAAIRDVGRALGIAYKDVDAVAKLIPNELKITIKKALDMSNQLKGIYNSDSKIKELIDMAIKLEGTPRNVSTHAAGVVITRLPVDNYVPLAKSSGMVITQYPMTQLEELGLLKIDFLGLRTLTVISDAEKMVRRHTPDFSIERIPFDDEATWKLLQSGNTDGLFQIESAGMKNVLQKLVPTCLEDLIAVISLYRPGPSDSIDTYIANRHNPDKIKYETPLLEDILKVTYGCMIYQEQVMEVFRKLAGYSYGRADIVRRAMSKKKHDVLLKEREAFVYGKTAPGEKPVEGAIANGIDETTANRIFDSMTSFASYAFNKSHAAAYATVAYRTAYLKRHYPAEFMAALLTSVLDSTDKVAKYISECKRMGITVLPPDINSCYAGFVVEDNRILFGLLAIKNLGRPLIESIIEERKHGNFKDFYDFCKRMFSANLNRRAVECLIKSGAFDRINSNRKSMLQGTDMIFERLSSDKRNKIDGQIGLFDAGISGGGDTNDDSVLPVTSELAPGELLRMEKEVMGIYISGHPMSGYSELAKKIKADRIGDILESDEIGSHYRDGDSVILLGIISAVTLKTTRTKSTMAFLQLLDESGTIEVLVFPKTLEANPMLISEEQIVAVKGKISIREERQPQIVCDKILDTDQAMKFEKRSATLYIKLPNESDRRTDEILSMLSTDTGGDTALVFFFEQSKKSVKYKKRINLSQETLKKIKDMLGADDVILK